MLKSVGKIKVNSNTDQIAYIWDRAGAIFCGGILDLAFSYNEDITILYTPDASVLLPAEDFKMNLCVSDLVYFQSPP